MRRLVVGLITLATVGAFTGTASGANFVDPTAVQQGNIQIGDVVYVAPFATLVAGRNRIQVGDESDIQDSVTLDAAKRGIFLGKQVILAHGSTVKGLARVGIGGSCPGATPCPSFVGFNAEVHGATVQKDAMVGHLARVAPGVLIRSGLKVLPGKNVTTREEGKDTNLGKVAQVTAGDRMFMEGVIQVNKAFAAGYAALAAGNANDVKGISPAPVNSNSGATPRRDCTNLDTPTCTETAKDATFRNRITGDVRLSNTTAQLGDVMGTAVALRGDEGEPFKVGTIAYMDSRVTFHALEHTRLTLGNNGRYDYHSLVHGGVNTFNNNNTTQTGDDFKLGAHSVFFNSRVGNNSRVGFKSAVLNSDYGPNTTIADCKIISGAAPAGDVEWCY